MMCEAIFRSFGGVVIDGSPQPDSNERSAKAVMPSSCPETHIKPYGAGQEVPCLT